MRLSTTISAEPKQVWDVLADFPALAQWCSAVEHSAPATEQREGVGAARRVQLNGFVLREQVITWKPEERLAYTVSGLPPNVSRCVNKWTLEAQNGTTVVTLAMDLTTRGATGFVMSAALTPALTAASKQMLKGLKVTVESG